MTLAGESRAALLDKAVRQFNAGAYFAAHTSLETLWLDEADDLRDLYQGILQIAVALLHHARGNKKGAARLLTSGRKLILPFLPSRWGLDLAALAHDAELMRRRLERAGENARGPAEDPIKIKPAAKHTP